MQLFFCAANAYWAVGHIEDTKWSAEKRRRDDLSSAIAYKFFTFYRGVEQDSFMHHLR